MKRILCIDGGGIKGVFPASLLTNLESRLSQPIVDYFDLLVGTSTGGIIVLGLGLGKSAAEILEFYEKFGPTIFAKRHAFAWFHNWRRSKYDAGPLKTALELVFGDRLIGESTKRLVVPSLKVDTGEVHVWKTSHHPRLQHDYREKVITAALATSAAPTFFPTFVSDSGIPLLDGGLWANNPITVGLVEAIGILGWPRDEIRVLSIGCTTTPLDLDWGKKHSLGKLGWAFQVADLFMSAQESAAQGMAQHLVADRNEITRISPIIGQRYQLDGTSDILALKGLGVAEARKALPSLLEKFFCKPLAEPFVPCHRL